MAWQGVNEESVVLVDENDHQIGIAEKISVHRDGRLHRAVSVFIFDADDRLLLQQRAPEKHHFRHLWANSCCTHPRPDEQPAHAARRRLREELGLDIALDQVGKFVYKAEDPSTGLMEHELDYVFIGRSSAEPSPDPREVAATQYVPVTDLLSDLEENPDQYVPWLRPALQLALDTK